MKSAGLLSTLPSVIKVAQVRWGEPFGGVERVLRDLAYNIDRKEFKLKFIFLRRSGAYESEMRESGHEVVVIPARNGYDIRMRISLIKELRKFSPDIVNEHGALPPLIRPIIKIATRVPLISFEHGEIEINKRKGKSWINPINGFELRNFSDYIIVNSQWNKDLIVSHHHLSQEKIRVVYLGIDLNHFTFKEATASTNELVLGYCGRILNYDKGTDYLPLLAHELIKHGFDKFHLKVIGDGPDRLSVESLSKRLGVEKQLEFLGRQSDILNLLAGIDILIVPSKTEAFGLPAIEALAVGTRVVAFGVGALPEVLSDCQDAKIISQGNVPAMAEAIINIWKRYGKNRSTIGRNFVSKRYDARRMVRELEDVYKTNAINLV
jgi:glycosyltransferase involved in cell wall biosynthesis